MTVLEKQLPVYELLFSQCSDQDLTPEQKTFFVTNIDRIDTPITDLFYMIIRVYFNTHGNTAHALPYDAKVIKKGVKFQLNRLPNKLQQMLFKFLEQNLELQQESICALNPA